jgi:hypothetical protein
MTAVVRCPTGVPLGLPASSATASSRLPELLPSGGFVATKDCPSRRLG